MSFGELHPRDFEAEIESPVGASGSTRTSVRWLGTAGYELRCDGTR